MRFNCLDLFNGMPLQIFENEKSLQKKILKIEHDLYPKAIKKILISL